MLSNVKDINHFCKLKLNNIEIGLSTYDTFIRYTKIPTLNKVSFELIVLFSHAISSYFFIRNFLETEGKNIKISVQSETVFNPLNIFFQICLQKKIDVFARCGENEISLRRYTNWSQRHDYRYNISNKFFKFIEKKISKDKYNKIYLIYQKKKKNLKYGFDTKIPLVNYSNLKLINRDQILKSFNWHKNKKIIVFFMNVLIDRNFHNGPRLNFKDNYSWTKYILDKMRKINNVNWIIKKHPIQNLYNSTYNFENEIKEICQNNKHIKVYPEKFSNSCLLDIADKIITSHGTAGIEYPAHGVESLFVEKSLYSNMHFNKIIKNKKELLNKLKKLNYKNRLKINIKKKSLIFLYIQDFIIKVNCSLLPIYLISRKIDQEKFWKEASQRLNKKDYLNDNFFKMLQKQINYKMRHTSNLETLRIKPSYLNDFND